MSPIGGERASVQNPMIRYAQEAGWEYLPADEALRLRRGEGKALLHDVLVKQLQRLNPGIVDLTRAEQIIARLERVPPTIEGNLQVWEYLKGLRTVFVEEAKRERNVRLLDPDNVQANTYHVTDEFSFYNGTHRIRADVVFLINGLPVIIVETKSARTREGIAVALDQIRRYHRQGPELLSMLQVQTLTHLIQFYYGATWSLSSKYLFNWRDEQAGDYETLVKTFVSPRRVLRVLTEFILFTRKDDELSKVILRPHQMRAVERVLQRARDPLKRRGLVWHTQGSGKTYTMITAAKLLIEDPSLENPSVLMVVDRNELETQLFGNLESVGFGTVAVAESKRDLRDLLRGDQRGLIVSMIHKFDDMPAKMSKRANIFVLVDEAHRTTGGDLGNYLMGALPNATYLGFTGTPIDRTAYGKGTFKTFGTEDPNGYLDKYSILESIQDGTTVPLHYGLASNDLRVDRETLDREFLEIAELEGVSDTEVLNRVLERAVNLKNMLKNPSRVRQVAAYVMQHYTGNVEPMGYKAFLVAVDREACAMLKRELDQIMPSEYSTVVYSAAHNDPPEIAAYHLRRAEEKQVRKNFRDPEKLPKILIVTDKLLTGFDAPILYCMYLDKPMRDHVLLQAIARVNRPYEDREGRDKSAGLVYDFVGIFANLQKALAFDSEDVRGVIEGLDVVKQRFSQLMTQGRKLYLAIWKGLRGDKAAEAVLEHFRDKELRDEFYSFFRELQDGYEIISPDAFLSPYLKDYRDLSDMYDILQSNYDRHIIVDYTFLRKTARLVQEHTETYGIVEPSKIHKLDEEALRRIFGKETSDTVKVYNLVRALETLVSQEGRQAPHLIPIGERAEQIARAFEERLITVQQALSNLEKLIAEYGEAVRNRKDSDLSVEGFGVYWLLKSEDLKEAGQVAQELESTFRGHPHWKMSAAQEREVRTAMYRALLGRVPKENVVEIADRIITVLKKAEG